MRFQFVTHSLSQFISSFHLSFINSYLFLSIHYSLSLYLSLLVVRVSDHMVIGGAPSSRLGDFSLAKFFLNMFFSLFLLHSEGCGHTQYAKIRLK